MSKQSKRAKFAHRARRLRVAARITRANAHKPGFIGVVHTLTINGKRSAFGMGAMFIGGVER